MTVKFLVIGIHLRAPADNATESAICDTANGKSR
jgi:hypothetical protein